MATTRKPAARKTTAAAKKTTTRGPRKKAVLAPPAAEIQPPALNEDQKRAKLEAYWALKSANLDIPQELLVVEAWIEQLNAEREAEAQRQQEVADRHEAKLAEANKNGPWYVRNCYPAPFNIRLDRQTEQRRIQLKPRGTPGDLHPLKDEDLKDPVLKQNLGLGLIEVLPAGEAQSIIDKQTTNMGHRVHTPLAVLRGESGKPYEQGAVKVEAEFNSQGVTVAQVDRRILRGEATDKEIGGTRATGGLTRVQPGQVSGPQASDYPQQATSVVRSGFVPTGGNPAIIQYGLLGDNAHAAAIDDIARRKNIQGPGAGLGDVQVVVDPVVRT